MRQTSICCQVFGGVIFRSGPVPVSRVQPTALIVYCGRENADDFRIALNPPTSTPCFYQTFAGGGKESILTDVYKVCDLSIVLIQ